MRVSALTSVLLLTAQAQEGAPRPKFGVQATRLVDSHGYIKRAEASDFWALIPYYSAQFNGKACSVASVAMVLNAARAHQKLTASDALVLQEAMLKKVGDSQWIEAVGASGKGVTLDLLADFTRRAFQTYGFAEGKVTAQHASQEPKDKADFVRALTENEKGASTFMIANFLQSELTGDPEGAVGHIAPIAAYDAKSKRVLIMDPDREWYEPYWVSVDTLWKGMQTEDPVSKKMRGYVWIKIKN